MNRVLRCILITLGAVGLATFVSFAQDTPTALTNKDIIGMVRSGLGEVAIVATIRSNPANYDLSPDGLIKLHVAKVTEAEMSAMMSASEKGAPVAAAPPAPILPSAPPTPTADAAPAATKTKSRIPVIAYIQNGAEQRMPLEKTQLAQTKNKPVSMGKLAADGGMQGTMSTATADIASHTGIAGGAVSGIGSAFGSVLGQRKPEVTYVWAVASAVSATVLSSDSPQFSINFSTMPGINPDDFEPQIVKLTPAQNSMRLVGASRGKEDALADSAVNWQVYSGFVEDRVKIQSKKLGPGQYQISPVTQLLPGEYGVVMRPVSKDKKFSGGDVMRAQGDGLMFDAVWSFQVSTEGE